MIIKWLPICGGKGTWRRKLYASQYGTDEWAAWPTGPNEVSNNASEMPYQNLSNDGVSLCKRELTSNLSEKQKYFFLYSFYIPVFVWLLLM